MAVRKFTSIKEALNQVAVLNAKCSPLQLLNTQHISSAFKTLIARCNSLAIVFLQYKLHNEVLKLLKTAAAADINLYKYGSLMDRLWQGRLVTYNNLVFFFQQ